MLADTVAELSFYVRLKLGGNEVGPPTRAEGRTSGRTVPHAGLTSGVVHWRVHPQVRTDVVRNSISPKFLKDVRMNVPSPESDVLRVRWGPTHAAVA